MKQHEDLTDTDRARRVLGRLWRDIPREKEAADKLLTELRDVLKEFGVESTEPNADRQKLVNVFSGGDKLVLGYSGARHKDDLIAWGLSERHMNIAGFNAKQWNAVELSFDYGTGTWRHKDGRGGLEALCQAVADAFKVDKG